MKKLKDFKQALTLQILDKSKIKKVKGGTPGNGNGPMNAQGNGFGHNGGCPPPWEEN